ncbi:MAG: EAL domain-containing protein [Halomonas sp.]
MDERGEVSGREALLRWEHPQQGMISPGEFIPLAEETGLIVPIGRWVVETACHRLAAWAEEPELADQALSVSTSARCSSARTTSSPGSGRFSTPPAPRRGGWCWR